MYPFRIILATGFCTCVALAQNTHVVPDGLATVEGNDLNNIPWGSGPGVRAQFLYDSSHFTGTATPINYPILIQRLRWRANGSATAIWTGGTYSQALIEMSTAATDFATPSPAFDGNHGQDRTTVLSGPVTMAPQPTGFGVPGPWYVDAPLATGFFYDPTSGGDLLIDIDIPTGTWSGGTRSIMDYQQSSSVMASRVSASLTYGSPTGTVAVDECAVVEVSYIQAVGLFPRFTATPTTGISPLQVQFTDISFTTDPTGIMSWSWDFENDGIVDSNQQNPTHTYPACGSYAVRLTVVDGTHGSRSIVRPNAVVVDAIAADFTGTPLAGLPPVFTQFTDTSTGPVASWAWDFNGDGVVDSNQQNPLWGFGIPGSYTVSLTIGNGCFSDTLTRADYVVVIDPANLPAAPELLQYQFNEVRGQEVANTATSQALPAHGTVNTAGWQGDPGRRSFRGNEPGAGMLAHTSTASATNLINTGGGLTVTGDMTIMWWQRQANVPPSTAYVCGSSSGAGPRIYTGGRTAGTSLIYRGSSIGDVLGATDIQSSIGQWMHVALVVDDAGGTATWYFDGNPDPARPFTAATHTASITELHIGYGSSATTARAFPMFFDLDDFRIYSRALSAGEVQAAMLVGEDPSAGTFGSSCDGPGGTPLISVTGVPVINNPGFAITLSNAEDARLVALILGLAPAAFGTFDLSAILGPGCQLEVDWFSANFQFTAGGAATQSAPIANNPSIRGLHVYGQWLILGTTGAATRAIDISIK